MCQVSIDFNMNKETPKPGFFISLGWKRLQQYPKWRKKKDRMNRKWNEFELSDTWPWLGIQEELDTTCKQNASRQTTQDNETLFPIWQKESWQTSEETSIYVRPERVNKWPNSMTDIWWWWDTWPSSMECLAITTSHWLEVTSTL